MKILIGILVIVLANFLNNVELGTPLGLGFSFRPGAAPRPVVVSSGRSQTTRGGRHEGQQSRSTPQPAAAPKAAPKAPPKAPPEASTSAARPVHIVDKTEERTPIDAHIEQPQHGLTKLEQDERRQSGSPPRPAAPEAPPATQAHQPIGMRLHILETPGDVYIEDTKLGFIKMNKEVSLCRFQNILIGIIDGEYIRPIFNERHEIIRIDYNKNGLRIPMNRTEAKRWGVFRKWAKFRKTPPPAFF